MAISTIQIILIFIWSSVVGMGSVLDEFQTHRPLIACSVMGLILGDPKTGIILGGTLELIALGWMNIGAAQSPDSALASTISTILVIVGNQDIQKGIAIALPVAAAGQVLTVLARTVTTIVAVFVSPEEIKSMLDALPQVITGGLTVAGGFIVVVGYAMILNMMSVKYLMPFFYLGFVLGGYLKLSLLAWGAVGLIFAIIYVQLNPKFAQNHSNGSGSSGGAVASAGDHPAELPEDELDD